MLEDNPFAEESIKSKPSIFIDILQTIVVALAIFVIIYLFIATPNEVKGHSMDPTFKHGELLLTNKIVQLLGGDSGIGKIVGDYNRGDIVIFKDSVSGEDFIKRVIAKDGDTISIQKGYVYVNEQKLEEEYLPAGRTTNTGTFIEEGETLRVPNNSYFVMGDNRGNSKDSRDSTVGFIDRSQMRGRVFFRYWPLNRLGLIRGHEYIAND